MSHTNRVVLSIFVGCLLASTTDVLLAHVGAEPGWYYAVGVCLTVFMTYRILVPAFGVPARPGWLASRGSNKDKTHIPRSHA
jgi:hypothetical protein